MSTAFAFHYLADAQQGRLRCSETAFGRVLSIDADLFFPTRQVSFF